MSRPLVSTVVLSYSWTQHLRDVLASIVDQSYPNLEILLVENHGAARDDALRIAGAFPSIRLIQNPANLGFTGGMNAGIASATGHYVYLTEDDVVLGRDCIAALVAFMNDHAEAGLAAPIMYNKGDGTIRSAGGRMALGPVHTFTIHGEGQRDTGQYTEPFEVTYIPGASVFARTALLQSMNGFRDDFFVYGEDSELCMRVLKSGLRIFTVPAAKIEHFEPPDGPASDLVSFLRYRNFLIGYILHAPARVLPEFFLRYGAANLARTLVHDRHHALLMLKGWGWILAHLPRLLRDRDRRPFPAHVG